MWVHRKLKFGVFVKDTSSVLLLREGYCVREFLGVWECEFLCIE